MNLQGSQLEGESLESFVGLFGKSANTWMHTIHAWSEDPSSHQSGDTYAEQLTLETGRVVMVHLAPVIWRNEFLGTVSIFRDITHEVEVDRLKSEFVATVSHELRTPMTSIKGYVDILLMGAAGAFNEKQTHFLEVVQNNAERLNVLVNDLLDISRIEAGRYELNEESISLVAIVEDCHHLLKLRATNRDITIHEMFEADLPRLWADERAVRQICLNLLSNAIKFTPQGGEIWLKAGWTASGGQYMSVKDTGPGIPEEEIPVVLASFGQGTNSIKSAEQGAGLGRPIAKSLVDLHGGSFVLKSKLRIGTEVVVTFPPERVVAAMAPMREQAPPIAPAPNERILRPEAKRRLTKRPLFRAGM